MKAIWNGKVIAESDDTVFIEGNQYFPKESIKKEFFKRSNLETVCHWKGTATYFDLVDGDTRVENAAWDYQNPIPGSEKKVGKDYKDYVAFYPAHVLVTA